MQDRVTYEYAVIRLMPKVEREEFMNIGVILFSKPLNFLQLKFNIDEQRIKSFSSDIDLETVCDYLEGWKNIAEANDKGGKIGTFEAASRFRWLTASKSTIIQCSAVHPGLSANPGAVLEEIFERYVL